MREHELFFNLAKGYVGADTNEDYVKYFNQGQENEVIARIYTQNYRLFEQTSKRFTGVDDATRDSLIVENIWKCLSTYDESKSNGKIITMICTYVRNALRTLTQSMNTKKGKVNSQSKVFSSYEDEDRVAELSTTSKTFSDIEIKDYIDSLDLKGNQKRYCEVILDSKEDLKMSDIARELNVSRAGALSIKRALQGKLAELIA